MNTKEEKIESVKKQIEELRQVLEAKEEDFDKLLDVLDEESDSYEEVE